VVTRTGTRAIGLPSSEVEAARNSTEVPTPTPELPHAPGVNDAATRAHQNWPFLANRRWIGAIAALLIVSSFILGLIIPGLGKRNFELPSILRSQALRTPKVAKSLEWVQGLSNKHYPAQSCGQPRVGCAQDARRSFGVPQQDPRTVSSTAQQSTSESSARETVDHENPAREMTAIKPFGKSPNIDKVPNSENKSDSVSESMMSSIPAPHVNNRAGLATNIVLGRLIHEIKPIYPPAALKAQIQGSVVLQVMVDKDGAVHDVRFVSGPPILAPAAIHAVENWQYKPSYLNGWPLESEMLVTVKFSLR